MEMIFEEFEKFWKEDMVEVFNIVSVEMVD